MAAKVGFITGTSRGFGREWAIAGSVAPVEDRIGQAWLMRRRPRRVSASRSNFSGFRFRVSRTLKGADVGRAAGCGAA
jgi:hypothetical protein